MKEDTKYIVSDKYPASILFDDLAVDEWLTALEDQDHITEFYMVTQDDSLFNDTKEKIQELLGDIIVQEPIKKPMSDGYESNCEYFKLGFLDKNEVVLEDNLRNCFQFYDESRCYWKRPEIVNEKIPDIMILSENRFAVLVNESHYMEFEQQIEAIQRLILYLL